jgi:hypothetical protein
MPRTKISEFSSTPASNTDIDSINISEGCAPSGINDAIRELMAQLKDWQSGTSNDPYVVGSSGSLTLNQGTANGVAYLNGSKVVTSGSALTFDGTNYLNVTGLRIGGSDTTNTIYQATGALALSTGSTSPITFNVNVSEVGRFTSTGLGIGTSSPSQKLHVVAAGGYNATFSENSSNKVRLQFYVDGNEAALVSGYDTTAKPMTFYTGGSLRATLDTSGNLGLGVTPSAWNTSRKVFQGTGGSLMLTSGNNSLAVLFANTFENTSGSYRYQNTGSASYYQQYNSVHSWYTAASGTAGNAITFTQAMSLTASGDWLLGKTNAGLANNGIWITSAGQSYNTIPDGENTLHVYSSAASAYRFYVSSGGTINATNTTITAISDQRLKENIRDLDDGLATVMALKPRKFDWKDGKGANIKNARGFIAQEFETVLPDMIEEWLDPAPEGEAPYKAVNANLIPTLVKAIQELKLEFDAYKATHP